MEPQTKTPVAVSGGTWPKCKARSSSSLSSGWTDDKVRPPTRDEFWEALMSNYNYLMDEGLIASCREANGDLYVQEEEGTNPTYFWSFTEFIQQFNKLHDCLHKLQNAVPSEQGLLEAAGVVMEDLQKIAYLCKHFNEQAQRLGRKYPDMKDEIQRRVNLLNNKWEAVEQAITPHKPPPVDEGVFQEVAYQMKCMRKWLREIEARIQRLVVHSNWKLEDLETMYSQQQVLQREIEDRGKYVSALLKSCEQLNQAPEPVRDIDRVKRVAQNLERRWHALWLRSLEWQYLVEELIRGQRVGQTREESPLDLSLTDEPLRKHPRLSNQWDSIMFPEQPMPVEHEQISSPAIFNNESLPLTNDKGVMVGVTGIAELKAECGGSIGRFEIVQDVGYSSESSAHHSNDERQDFIRIYSYSPVSNKPVISEYTIVEKDESKEGDIPPNESSVPFSYLAPDKYPSHPLNNWHISSEDEVTLIKSKTPLHNSTKTANFYTMTSIPSEICDEDHLDSDVIDREIELLTQNFTKTQAISKEENKASPTFGETSKYSLKTVISLVDLNQDSNSSIPSSPSKQIQVALNLDKVQLEEDSSTQEELFNSDIYDLESKLPKATQVKEWLQNCQPSDDASQTEESDNLSNVDSNATVLDSSCDASGEYTTNESDSDRSDSGEDVNGNLSQSQSFAGSVETVVPMETKIRRISKTPILEAPEEKPGSPEKLQQVVLRTKKKRTRGRPWSVTEVCQNSSHIGLSLFSTSEGALNTLVSSKILQNRSCVKTPKTKSAIIEQPTRIRRRHNQGSDSGSMSSVKKSGSDNTIPRIRRRRSSPIHNRVRHSQIPQEFKKTSPIKSKPPPSSSHQEIPTNVLPNIIRQTDIDLGPLEDQSSLSDQVWDGYQDPPYFSEPYSEQALDEEEVRKLMEFGDDYRAFIGSDASSVGGLQEKRRISSRNHQRAQPYMKHRRPRSDSDSESEELRQILSQNSRALQNVKSHLLNQTEIERTACFPEFLATCHSHLKCLKDIELHMEGGVLSSSDRSLLQDLICEWEKLQQDQISQQHKNESAVSEVQKFFEMLPNKMSETLSADNESYSSLSELDKKIKSLLEITKKLTELTEVFANRMPPPLTVQVSCFLLKWEELQAQANKHLDHFQLQKSRWETFEELAAEAKPRLSSGNEQAQELLNKMEDVARQFDEALPRGQKPILGHQVHSLRTPVRKIAPRQHTPQPPSRFWRVVKFAVPLQLTLILLCCLASMMEPHCCDFLRSTQFMIMPQLRYQHGPPPV